MSAVSGRHFIVARFILCVCAIVGVSACRNSDSDDIKPPPQASAEASEAPAATGTSELQDWAKQATSSDSTQPARASVARVASDALVTPVIHTVD